MRRTGPTRTPRRHTWPMSCSSSARPSRSCSPSMTRGGPTRPRCGGWRFWLRGCKASPFCCCSQCEAALRLRTCPPGAGSSTPASYEELGDLHPWGASAVRSFWRSYLPEGDDGLAHAISPARAPTAELGGLPAALVITAGADVARDEGEAAPCRRAHHGSSLPGSAGRLCCDRRAAGHRRGAFGDCPRGRLFARAAASIG